jgi:heme-degrading monooxygenase HmoA
VIVRITSIAVPEPVLNAYLEQVQSQVMVDYERAAGLVSVWVTRRPFVAYVELMTVSLWESEWALNSFVKNVSEYRGTVDYGAIRLEPRTYEVLLFREGPGRMPAPDAQHGS